MTGPAMEITVPSFVPARPGWLRPVLSLLQREIKRFLRQRARVFGALGQPLLFWLLLGSGFGASFQPPGSPPGTGYMVWFFPGITVMVVLFTAIFSTISIIEDRKEGFLQAVLVAPVPRSAIVLGKVLGSSALATGQGLLVLLAAPLLGLPLSPVGVALAILTLGATATALSGLGVCIAWRMDSTQGFHMIMNLFLLPMWLLSGSFFPLEGTPPWLRLAMELNPLTYAVGSLRRSLAYGSVDTLPASVPSLSLGLAVTLFFCLLTLVTAAAIVRTSRDGGT